MTLPLLVCAVLVGGGLFFAAWSLVVVRDRAPSDGTAVLGRIERYATPSRVPSDPRERHSAWRNLIGSLRRALSARERPRGEVGDVRDQLNDRLRKAGIPLRAIEWRGGWGLAGVLGLGGGGARIVLIGGGVSHLLRGVRGHGPDRPRDGPGSGWGRLRLSCASWGLRCGRRSLGG